MRIRFNPRFDTTVSRAPQVPVNVAFTMVKDEGRDPSDLIRPVDPPITVESLRATMAELRETVRRSGVPVMLQGQEASPIDPHLLVRDQILADYNGIYNSDGFLGTFAQGPAPDWSIDQPLLSRLSETVAERQQVDFSALELRTLAAMDWPIDRPERLYGFQPGEMTVQRGSSRTGRSRFAFNLAMYGRPDGNAAWLRSDPDISEIDHSWYSPTVWERLLDD